MNNPTFNAFFTSLEEIGRALNKAARYAVGAIASMSWPTLLISCILLALFVTIVPLVIALFVIFMAVKLVHGYMTERAQRGKATPYTPVKDQAE